MIVEVMIVSILCGGGSGNEPLTPILTEYCQVNVAQAIVFVAAILLLIIGIVFLLIKSKRRLVCVLFFQFVMQRISRSQQ